MSIIFDHVAGLGKITSGDFIHAPAAMYNVPDEDIAEAMAQGWAVDEWHLPRRMYQARQVRLRVPDKINKTLPDGVTWSVEQNPDVDMLVDIYQKYRAKKQFSDHMPIEQTLCLVDRYAKCAIVFSCNRQPVAFTLVRIHSSVMSSLQFCWDYAEPRLRLGFVSQDVEFIIANTLGCEHVYIGPGYETACAYKARLPGFEWWTGQSWSTDSKLFAQLLERDSHVQAISELIDVAAAA